MKNSAKPRKTNNKRSASSADKPADLTEFFDKIDLDVGSINDWKKFEKKLNT